jgi:hypothetical protein
MKMTMITQRNTRRSWELYDAAYNRGSYQLLAKRPARLGW